MNPGTKVRTIKAISQRDYSGFRSAVPDTDASFVGPYDTHGHGESFVLQHGDGSLGVYDADEFRVHWSDRDTRAWIAQQLEEAISGDWAIVCAGRVIDALGIEVTPENEQAVADIIRDAASRERMSDTDPR